MIFTIYSFQGKSGKGMWELSTMFQTLLCTISLKTNGKWFVQSEISTVTWNRNKNITPPNWETKGLLVQKNWDKWVSAKGSGNVCKATNTKYITVSIGREHERGEERNVSKGALESIWQGKTHFWIPFFLV